MNIMVENQELEPNSPEISDAATPDKEKGSLRLSRFLKRKHISVSTAVSILVAFAIGLSSGYLAWVRETLKADPAPTRTLAPRATQAAQATPTNQHPHAPIDVAALSREINPPEGYALRVKPGKIGPQLLAAGAIDYKTFVQVYANAGQPLTDEQITILTKGSDQPVIINQDNAYFLLNFFWAVGLINQNTILTQGPMMRDGKDNAGNYASTAGWTIGAKLPVELYASTQLISLTAEQQKRLEEVAHNVFRPCCNNPTDFPDCNHGMAMLGLLELMAAQNATVDELFKAAKYVNAYWYPQQSLELAVAFKAERGADFTAVDARELTSAKYSSGSGFKAAHQWLANNGLLQQGPGGGNNCGV